MHKFTVACTSVKISRYESLAVCLPSWNSIILKSNISMSQLFFLWFQKYMVLFPQRKCLKDFQIYLTKFEYKYFETQLFHVTAVVLVTRYLFQKKEKKVFYLKLEFQSFPYQNSYKIFIIPTFCQKIEIKSCFLHCDRLF